MTGNGGVQSCPTTTTFLRAPDGLYLFPPSHPFFSKKMIFSCVLQNKYVILYSNLMHKVMRSANYSEMRANMKHYLDSVINDNEPLLVHRQGQESVVVMSLADYNAITETEYIMKSKAMMEAIKKGEEDIADGRSITKADNESMEEFLARCIK